MAKPLRVTFWAMMAIFLVILSEFFVPFVKIFVNGTELFLLPIIIFFLMGLLMVYLTVKSDEKGLLRRSLLLAGASSAGFFVFIFLHNAFYALNTLTKNILLLKYLTEGLHIVSFIVAVFICPAGFLVGAAAVIYLQFKKTV
ncbi:MAG: hypothetical protein ABIH89_00280 [Elusimicrobiota bacterium]